MNKKKTIKKIIYIILGFVGIILGAIGAIMPMIPSFPFLMLSAFCFGKSSKRLDNWFKGTKLYKNNLESFVKGQGMTQRTKIKIMITITILMSIGCMMMYSRGIYLPCIILGFVWIFHIIYFSLFVKKYKA